MILNRPAARRALPSRRNRNTRDRAPFGWTRSMRPCSEVSWMTCSRPCGRAASASTSFRRARSGEEQLSASWCANRRFGRVPPDELNRRKGRPPHRLQRGRNRSSSANSISHTIPSTAGGRSGAPGTAAGALHNTDPFIFASRFLCSNCGQGVHGTGGLWFIDYGSLIAFGSGRKIGGQPRWVLDTVLVVKDSRLSDPREALEGWVPEGLLEVTGGPLMAAAKDLGKESGAGACGPTSERFRLYRGATPDDPVDEMFSVFRAVPTEGRSRFARPMVSLDENCFNPRNWQAPKGTRVSQVREAGLVLGSRAEMPECQTTRAQDPAD